MAKTRDLKRRIRSIRNTMQVTRAMKMVSAAKLRRSQERIVAARPYARRMLEVLRSLASRANPAAHPLLAVREERRIDVLVITADRGLCGSFNANVHKAAVAFLGERAGLDVRLRIVGRKGRDRFRRDRAPIASERIDLYRTLSYETAAEIAGELLAPASASPAEQGAVLAMRAMKEAEENLASRLLSVAQTGEVVLSESLAELLKVVVDRGEDGLPGLPDLGEGGERVAAVEDDPPAPDALQRGVKRRQGDPGRGALVSAGESEYGRADAPPGWPARPEKSGGAPGP